MPSQLVTDVRRLLADRADQGAPLTDLERTFLLAAIAPRTTAGDVVDELDAAIEYGRRVLLADPPRGTDPAVVAQRRREAARRLIVAARSALDYDPFLDVNTDLDELPGPGRPYRVDVDG